MAGGMLDGSKKIGGGRTNERPGTDNVISGPMRGLIKLHPLAQTDKQTD